MTFKKNDIHKYEPLWGNWKVGDMIGRGSYGIVYKLYREDMGSKYISAVKQITVPNEDQYREAESSIGSDETTLSNYFQDMVNNIVREINMLYTLSGNSNILNYQDHLIEKKDNEIGWDILIRMEYAISLKKYLSIKRMSRGEIIRFGIDICNALDLCSRKGIIHRDIKDENIFVNEDGMFKLGDFGIARELSESRSASSMIGTPLYMAPEVFKGEKYDPTVDIYSLGLVMYKLLNYGRMPFMPSYPDEIKYKDNEAAFTKRMMGEPLPNPSNAAGELARIISKACAHRPDDRYQSPGDMKKDLEKVIKEIPRDELDEKVTLINVKNNPQQYMERRPNEDVPSIKVGDTVVLQNDMTVPKHEGYPHKGVADTIILKQENERERIVKSYVRLIYVLVGVILLVVVGFMSVFFMSNRNTTTNSNGIKVLSPQQTGNNAVLSSTDKNDAKTVPQQGAQPTVPAYTSTPISKNPSSCFVLGLKDECTAFFPRFRENIASKPLSTRGAGPGYASQSDIDKSDIIVMLYDPELQSIPTNFLNLFSDMITSDKNYINIKGRNNKHLIVIKAESKEKLLEIISKMNGIFDEKYQVFN